MAAKVEKYFRCIFMVFKGFKSICSLPIYFADTFINIIFETRDTFFEKGHRRRFFFVFNGQMKDDEVYGVEGTSYSFEYRVYDSRIGRFLSVDPLTGSYPWLSPYVFAENKGIEKLELEGLEARDPDDDLAETEASIRLMDKSWTQWGSNVKVVLVLHRSDPQTSSEPLVAKVLQGFENEDNTTKVLEIHATPPIMAPGDSQSFWRETIRNGKGGMGSVILPIAFEGVSSVFEKVEDKMKLAESSKNSLFKAIKREMSSEDIDTYQEDANSELVLTVSYFSDRTAGEKYEMEMDAISTLN